MIASSTAEREGLLADVIANPDDDAPRLIFADWLEIEAGEAERAEFVRVQCEIARRCHPVARETAYPAVDLLPLFGRERELLAGNGLLWLPPVPIFARLFNEATARRREESWRWRRGFVESLTLSAEDFIRHADGLTAACPLREVELTTFPAVAFGNGGNSGAYRLEGRPRWHVLPKVIPELPPAPLTRQLFAAEWPRIAFTLPEA